MRSRAGRADGHLSPAARDGDDLVDGEWRVADHELRHVVPLLLDGLTGQMGRRAAADRRPRSDAFSGTRAEARKAAWGLGMLRKGEAPDEAGDLVAPPPPDAARAGTRAFESSTTRVRLGLRLAEEAARSRRPRWASRLRRHPRPQAAFVLRRVPGEGVLSWPPGRRRPALPVCPVRPSRRRGTT